MTATKEMTWAAYQHAQKMGWTWLNESSVREIVEAALSASPAGVKPKPLEWVWVDDDHYAARALGLGYEVRKSQIRDSVRVRFAAGPFSEWQDFDGGIEAAKSAAFADYSARIMSAIEPAGVGVETPPPSSRASVTAALKGDEQ